MFIRSTSILVLFLCCWIFHAACQRVPKIIAEQINSYIVPIDLSANNTVQIPGFSEMVKDKSIVGIGESNHGDHEFDVGFAKMARQLIKYSGFNVVFLAESNFTDTRALNEYVLRGVGDAYTSLKYRFHHPISDVTKETVELAKWIREFNKGKPLDQRVWMLGGDVLFPHGHARDALEYCGKNNIVLPEVTLDALSELANLPSNLYIPYIKRNPLPLIQKKLAPLNELISTQDTIDFTLKEQWEYQSILSLNKALVTFYVLHDELLYGRMQPPRDSAMYEHIKWIKSMRSDAKIIIKAHNRHVEKQGLYLALNRRRLGWFLAEFYKDQYFAIATDECKGSFWAGSVGRSVPIPENNRKISSLVEKVVAPPTGVLPVNATPELTRFFNKKHRINHAGTSADIILYLIEDFAKAFDALFYVREAAPGKPDMPSLPIFKFSIVWDIPHSELNKNDLKISILSSYAFRENTLPNEGLSINLTFHDRDRQFVGFRTLNMTSGKQVGQVKVPDNAHTCFLRILGNNIQELTLESLVINEKDVDLQRLSVYNTKNQLNTAEENEVYVVKKESDQLIVKLQDAYHH